MCFIESTSKQKTSGLGCATQMLGGVELTCLVTKERAKQSLNRIKHTFPTHVTHMTDEK